MTTPGWRLVLVPVLAVVIAQALRPALDPWMGPQVAPIQMFAFLAVFVAAWAGGFWAGVLATVLTVVVGYFAVYPGGPSRPPVETADITRIALFTGISLIFSVLTEAHLRAQRRLADQRDALEAERAGRASADAKATSNRERLHLVADQIATMLANLDRDWTYKFVNRAYAERYHTTPAELVGRNAKDVLTPAVAQTIAPYVARALAGESVEFELTIPGDAGADVVRSQYVPERNEQGEVIGWVVAVTVVTEIKRAETRLKNFGYFVKNASDFIGMCDLDFKPYFVNDAGLRLVGLDSLEEMASKDVFDCFFPEDHEWLAREFFPAVMRDGHAKKEVRFRHFKTELPIWMEYDVIRMEDTDGRPTGYATISRDLSAQKRTESLQRQLADAMPHIVWSSGPDGNIDYRNRRWYELVGDSSPAADAYEAMYPDDRDRVLAAWHHSISTGRPFETEYRLVFPTQPEPRWYLGRGLPVRDEAGAIVRWYATSTDIHDQKMAEMQLGQSRERLRVALDASHTGTFRWDIESNALECDANLDRLFGLPPGSTARSLSAFLAVVHPDDRARVADACARCARDGSDFIEEYRVVWPDGTVRWLYDTGRIHEENGRRSMTGACVDVTERRQKEDALRTADRQKDEFLGMLAHELRNPLAPIMYSAALLERVVHEPAGRRSLDVINRQVRRMTRLVDDLLDVSRVTQGKVSLKRDTVDISALVAEAAEGSRGLMDARNHALHVDIRDPQLRVHGDAVRLGQVVENLLNNAAKYTPSGGRVAVTVRRDGDAAVISVRDTGVGIAPAMLPRVFALFVQAETSLDRSEGGLGIGLTLVDQLVRLHGGRVEARSEGLDRGSEFIVRLPTVKVDALAAAAAARSSGGSNPTFRILVVDDNRDSAESLGALLEAGGHTVRLAHEGTSVLQTALDFSPDLVLLDIGLPGLDGYQVVRQIRSTPALADLTVVATTGYGREEDRLRCLDAGFNDHLTKPVDSADLESVLATLASVQR
jgi:PAS domain S-box-containing protein